jgi:hypothetical protein
MSNDHEQSFTVENCHGDSFTVKGSLLNLLKKLLGLDVAAILGERLIYWALCYRQANLEIIGELVQKKLQEKNVTHTRAIKNSFAIEALVSAAYEDRTEFQKIWTNLLSNALDPNFKQPIRTAYIDIIQSLEPIDVQILLFFYENVEKTIRRHGDIKYREVALDPLDTMQPLLMKCFNTNAMTTQASIENLARNKFIKVFDARKIMDDFGYFTVLNEKGTSLTSLGVTFIRACII